MDNAAPPQITQAINALAKQCYAWESATGTLKALPQQMVFAREQVICDTVLDHYMPPIIGGMYGFGLGILVCFAYAVCAKMMRRLTPSLKGEFQAWFVR